MPTLRGSDNNLNTQCVSLRNALKRLRLPGGWRVHGFCCAAGRSISLPRHSNSGNMEDGASALGALPPSKSRSVAQSRCSHIEVRPRAPWQIPCEEAYLRWEVSKATFYRRLKDFRVGTYKKFDKKECQMILTPKAEEVIIEWVIHHWSLNDTQLGWQVRQFAALEAANQGVTLDTKDGLSSNGWYFRFLQRHPKITNRCIQQTESSRLKAQDPDVICAFFKELEKTGATLFPNALTTGRVGMLDEMAGASHHRKGVWGLPH